VKDNDIIMDEICGLLAQGAYYPINVIKENYTTVFEDDESSKKIANLLLGNSKKKNSKVLRQNVDSHVVYSLNPDFNFDDERKIVEATSITKMADVIRSMVHSQNMKALDDWLNNDLFKIIDSIVEDKIKEELTKEVVPALKGFIHSGIDDRVSKSKNSFKKLLLEVISDIIISTDDD